MTNQPPPCLPGRISLAMAPAMSPDQIIVVNLSGRGDKDVDTASRWFGLVDDQDRPAEQGTFPAVPGDLEHLRELARGTLDTPAQEATR